MVTYVSALLSTWEAESRHAAPMLEDAIYLTMTLAVATVISLAVLMWGRQPGAAR